MRKKLLAVALALFLFLFQTGNAYAQQPAGPVRPNASADIPTLQGLEQVFQNVVTAALGLTAIVLFAYLLYGGISHITAGGNPDKISGARNAITYAIYGVILIALSYFILRVIQTLTGVNALLNFKIGQ